MASPFAATKMFAYVHELHMKGEGPNRESNNTSIYLLCSPQTPALGIKKNGTGDIWICFFFNCTYALVNCLIYDKGKAKQVIENYTQAAGRLGIPNVRRCSAWRRQRDTVWRPLVDTFSYPRANSIGPDNHPWHQWRTKSSSYYCSGDNRAVSSDPRCTNHDPLKSTKKYISINWSKSYSVN